MKKTFKKMGFTLAEIMLALCIIGIIFGLSVPALQNSTANRERDSQIMKLYPILDNVIDWIVLEYVDVDSVPFGQKQNGIFLLSFVILFELFFLFLVVLFVVNKQKLKLSH